MRQPQVDDDLTTFRLHKDGGRHALPAKKEETTLKKWDIDYFEALIRELKDILGDMERLENGYADELAAIHPSHLDSAKNLLHYIALRKRDIRELQTELASMGLSSLGRSESHVMSNVLVVLDILEKLSGGSSLEADRPDATPDLAQGTALLDIHTKDLFGKPPEHRDTYIMVTMPSQAATDYQLMKTLLADGMDCVRINCAHDDAEAWSGMIENLRRAEKDLNKKCRIFMDLAGHKLRTGPIENLPASARWSPKHDPLGEVSGPARIWLTPSEQKTPPAAPMDACIPVPGKWLSALNAGDSVEFTDTRGKKRSLDIVAAVGKGRVAECFRSAFIVNGVKLLHKPQSPDDISAGEVEVNDLPSKEQFILLARGDMLILTKGRSPGKPPVYDTRGQVLKPATVGVTAPEVFAFVKPGDRIWFNDGKIGGVIRFKNKDQVHVEITQAGYNGSKLRSGKGINLPDSELKLPALTKKDLADLTFIAANADAVCFSFINDASDVYDLQSQLEKHGGKDLGIVLKIETLHAFEHLPGILFAAMRSPRAGVMIARGDLAVECGFERMAEIQEEMLWFCEAAHLPVIWATEVLEKLAKKGQPSRAEITDAAMSVRAECVMLNKGPYITDALLILDDILSRMRAHQNKKSSMLRELKLAHRLEK